MTRSDPGRGPGYQARTMLDRAWIDESDATALVSAVQARVAQHRRSVAAARQERSGPSGYDLS
jgi:hypothetical protein